MTRTERLQSIEQRDRALRRVRVATAMAGLTAAVGGGVLTIALAEPSPTATTASAHTATTSTAASTDDDDSAATAPAATTSQGSAATSGGS